MIRPGFLFSALEPSRANLPASMKHHAPAADRNKDCILDVLRPLLPDAAFVVTIAEGSGQHVVHFATHLPHVTFQPTDVDPEAIFSIEAYRAQVECPNVRPAMQLDAAASLWPIQHASAITCINMIHISPWSSTEGLFQGAARLLAPGGFLLTYGPYRFSGVFHAPSNQAFDESLRSRNPAWGVRDIDDLMSLAASVDLGHEATIAMPANNHCVVFRKSLL